jgi:hypothetical protein
MDTIPFSTTNLRALRSAFRGCITQPSQTRQDQLVGTGAGTSPQSGLGERRPHGLKLGADGRALSHGRHVTRPLPDSGGE